jgi:hypothetical protein
MVGIVCAMLAVHNGIYIRRLATPAAHHIAHPGGTGPTRASVIVPLAPALLPPLKL